MTKVEDLTGFPECLEGRVKTLHPRVHAGILADTRKPDHVAQLADLGVEPFELVVVNLYPFVATVASGASPDECVEQIDIGGPSMVRAAAKNHPSVAVVTDPATYADVLDAVRGGGFTLEQRKRLAAQAFVHTATYDVARGVVDGQRLHRQLATAPASPPGSAPPGTAPTVLRYGENPHQQAALYTNGFQPRPALAQAEQLHGKEMSYNNYVDADAAVRAAHDHGDQPTVADHQAREPVRHRGRRRRRRRAPQGPRVRPGLGLRRRDRHQPPGDRRRWRAPSRTSSPRSSSRRRSTPTPSRCSRAKKNIRLLECAAPVRTGAEVRPIGGGLLMQQRDAVDARWSTTRHDRRRRRRRHLAPRGGDPADEATLADLQFAWRAVPCGQVERHPARPRRRLGRHRHGPGQPGRLLPARRVARR